MTTTERLDRYGIDLTQPRSGYRYNEDSIHLVDFISRLKHRSAVVDLGAGCGIIGLSLAKKFPGISVTAVELQQNLFGLLEKNVEDNGLTRAVTCINADFRKLSRNLHATFDAVVANPPYRKKETGRLSKDPVEAAARHESSASIGDAVAVAGTLLKDKGGLYAVFLAERLTDLVYAMRVSHIEPKVIQPVYPTADKNASVVLVYGVRKGGVGLTLLPPLFRR